MNKDRIMQNLKYAEVNIQALDAEGSTEEIESDLSTIERNLKDIHEAINSKPVMPKVFDDWYKRAVQLKEKHPDEGIDFFYGLANVYLDSFNAEKSWKDIAGWLRGDIDKYLKCIDAIRYGYEVEK